jgi:hypothetical protein
MHKRRKLIFLAIVLLVVAVGLVLILRPRNEPKYQGRYLSEWMEDHVQKVTPAEARAVNEAIENIGTNGLPFYVAWVGLRTPQWKHSLFEKLPDWLRQIGFIANGLEQKNYLRTAFGVKAIWLLGTNAVSAIPQLQAKLENRTNFYLVKDASRALAGIGPPSVPALRSAFANPEQINRPAILWSFRWLSFSGCSNDCMPIVIAALEDDDANVRASATNFLRMRSSDELFGDPPPPL